MARKAAESQGRSSTRQTPRRNATPASHAPESIRFDAAIPSRVTDDEAALLRHYLGDIIDRVLAEPE